MSLSCEEIIIKTKKINARLDNRKESLINQILSSHPSLGLDYDILDLPFTIIMAQISTIIKLTGKNLNYADKLFERLQKENESIEAFETNIVSPMKKVAFIKHSPSDVRYFPLAIGLFFLKRMLAKDKEIIKDIFKYQIEKLSHTKCNLEQFQDIIQQIVKLSIEVALEEKNNIEHQLSMQQSAF